MIREICTRADGEIRISGLHGEYKTPLTHLCLASRKRALANGADPDETPHDAASHLGLRCLLKGISSVDPDETPHDAASSVPGHTLS
ncbi:hypothetical protein DPMN_098174 [Dreissena polymorpha]|uniref:Uncharacterized protein n=1 Tax=Dreissena polymorpha TaxID=45954 RepID=A0A9D4LD39_DREPO|nr:hypothetical protein DPMN_098174 [Dreissena polymorpha]